MPEVEEYRIKIEAIKERLERSSGEGGEEIRELRERFGAVRDSLQRKQETIDSQKTEITALREENAQLSDMLGQAVSTLEAQSTGGIREIVQSIDSEFAGLLDEGEPQADGGDGGQQGPGPAETEPQEGEPQEGEPQEGETQEAETQEAEPQEGEPQEGESEDAKWDPENESAPALQRILARRNH